MNYNYLGGRSDFSIGESILKVSDYVAWGKEEGMKTLALCDTMSVSALPQFVAECEKADIKPIIGVRLRCVTDVEFRPETGEKRNMKSVLKEAYPKVWPINDDGMRDLLELLTKAFAKPNFYYVARIQYSDLSDVLARGNLLLTTGDFDGLGSLSDGGDLFASLRDTCPQNFWSEITPINSPYFDTVNANIAKWSGSVHSYFIAIRPSLYRKQDLADSRDVMAAIIGRDVMSSKFRKVIYNRDLDLETSRDVSWHMNRLLERSALHDNSAVDERHADWCAEDENKFVEAFKDKTWGKQPVTLPIVYEGDDYENLVRLVKVGFKARLGRSLLGHKPTADSIQTYKDRVNYELGVIKDMEFSRYFLLVENMVGWSKRQGIIVGPGRGSVGGSLVAYLLGITDVDPIRFGLLFERFINPERLDLPDADLDFQSSRRHEVIQFLAETYGTDRVAGISNFNAIASGSSLRDVGRVFELDYGQMSVSKLIPAPHGSPVSLETAAEEVPEIEKFSEENAEVWKHSCNLQGTMRSTGKHAAGVVVAGEPLMKRAVFETREGDPCINWDKRHCEDFGLVKIDILGLSTLDQLQIGISMLDEPVDLLSLPLDDPNVLDAFGQGKTVGVFQFESSGMRDLLESLAFGGRLTFDDLTAATSLYRPGPKDSGLLEDYVAIKQGLKTPYYDHDSLRAALGETFGVMVYQEQVMRVFTDLAGFTFAGADHARKAMGKKDRDKMEELRPKFIAGAMANKIPMKEAHAEELFNKIIAFAQYGFNKSHAVEYSIISYWTMWLKVYHPAQFYAASLTTLNDQKFEGIVNDAKANGISILPPQINHSTDRFEVLETADGVKLVAPFSSVKQVSENGAIAIMQARKKAGGRFLSMAHFGSVIEARKCNSRSTENLNLVGAFYEVEPGQKPPLHPDRLKDQMILMPGLIAEHIKADRFIPSDAITKTMLIKDVVKPMQSCEECSLSGGVHPTPRLGSKAKVMVLTDCPNFSEERAGKMFEGKASAYLKFAMAASGVSLANCYFTSVVKSPKSGKTLKNGQINGCRGFLNRELALLRPPIILTLGSAATKALIPDIKGNVLDHIGRVVYVPSLDASVVVGFNPAMISFDSAKQNRLNEVLAKVNSLLE